MNNKIAIECKCDVCKNLKIIMLAPNEYYRIKHGENIQDVLPHISIDDRELLISSICGSCFDKILGDE